MFTLPVPAVVPVVIYAAASTDRSTKTDPSPCPALFQAIVTGTNNVGSDEHLAPAKSIPAVTCTQAIGDDRHPDDSLPFIGVRLMTFTSDQYPKGRLVWVVASTPGIAIRNGGPPLTTPGSTVTTVTTMPPRYAYSIDLIDATTGKWLQGMSGT